MKKLLILTTLTSLLLAFSNASQASDKHDNRHRIENKRDQVHNISRSNHNRKVSHKQKHQNKSLRAYNKHHSDTYVSSHHERKAYRKHRRHSQHKTQHYYSDQHSYSYEHNYSSQALYYAHRHSDYYGRYYGYYDRYGRYQAYDYGSYDNYGRYHAHHHNSHCGHISTPVIGAVVAGLVIASIFD